MLEFVITTEKKKCSYVEKITRIIKIASLLSVLVVFWINVRRVVKYGMSLVATMQNVQKDLWATVDRNININKTQIPTSMIFYFWNFYKFVYL
jgi:undecaprenyl pyrophosphate phosphatase UppP